MISCICLDKYGWIGRSWKILTGMQFFGKLVCNYSRKFTVMIAGFPARVTFSRSVHAREGALPGVGCDDGTVRDKKPEPGVRIVEKADFMHGASAAGYAERKYLVCPDEGGPPLGAGGFGAACGGRVCGGISPERDGGFFN